ncbi:hypothetical protein GOODEAATRI_030246, partial [Goodea atripinnis]
LAAVPNTPTSNRVKTQSKRPSHRRCCVSLTHRCPQRNMAEKPLFPSWFFSSFNRRSGVNGDSAMLVCKQPRLRCLRAAITTGIQSVFRECFLIPVKQLSI